MIQTNKSPEAVAAAQTGRECKANKSISGDQSTARCAKRNPSATKNGRMLRLFLARGPLGVDSQAARLHHGDGSLHSTVSKWRNELGLEVADEWVKVPGWGGSPALVKRYWFPPETAERVRQLIREGRA